MTLLASEMAAAAMRNALRELCRDSGIDFEPESGGDLAAYFPFKPAEVATIYTCKHGKEPGLWFRLHDGRVFDKVGRPADDDPALYRA